MRHTAAAVPVHPACAPVGPPLRVELDARIPAAPYRAAAAPRWRPHRLEQRHK
jgi:hypothetical protein